MSENTSKKIMTSDMSSRCIKNVQLGINIVLDILTCASVTLFMKYNIMWLSGLSFSSANHLNSQRRLITEMKLPWQLEQNKVDILSSKNIQIILGRFLLKLALNSFDL